MADNNDPGTYGRMIQQNLKDKLPEGTTSDAALAYYQNGPAAPSDGTAEQAAKKSISNAFK